MHPAAINHTALRTGHIRQLTSLQSATGRVEELEAKFHAGHIKGQPLPASELKLATVRVQLRASRRTWTIPCRNVIAATVVLLFGVFWCDNFSSHSRLPPLEQKGLVVDIDTVADQI
jgi:hypothetical protein